MRAKFKCDSVTKYQGDHEEVDLTTQYSDTKEDNEFSQATPSGSLKMMIDNPKAKGYFVPGKDYYLDFTPAE
jgi:hypothetical protein